MTGRRVSSCSTVGCSPGSLISATLYAYLRACILCPAKTWKYRSDIFCSFSDNIHRKSLAFFKRVSNNPVFLTDHLVWEPVSL
jgi:hypothetical protein